MQDFRLKAACRSKVARDTFLSILEPSYSSTQKPKSLGFALVEGHLLYLELNRFLRPSTGVLQTKASAITAPGKEISQKTHFTHVNNLGFQTALCFGQWDQAELLSWTPGSAFTEPRHCSLSPMLCHAWTCHGPLWSARLSEFCSQP